MPSTLDFEVSIIFPKDIDSIHRLADLANSLDAIELISISWISNEPKLLNYLLYNKDSVLLVYPPFSGLAVNQSRRGLGGVRLKSLSINSWPELTAEVNSPWMVVLQFALVYGVLNYKQSKDSLFELKDDGSKVISKLSDGIQGLTKAQKNHLEEKIFEFRVWVSANGVEFSQSLENIFRAIAPNLAQEEEFPKLLAKPTDKNQND